MTFSISQFLAFNQYPEHKQDNISYATNSITQKKSTKNPSLFSSINSLDKALEEDYSGLNLSQKNNDPIKEEKLAKLEKKKQEASQKMTTSLLFNRILCQIDLCIMSCYEGSFQAFKKLESILAGKLEGVDFSQFDTTQIANITKKAEDGIKQLIDDAPKSPHLLKMFIENGKTNDKNLADAPSQLIESAGGSGQAYSALKALVNKGAISIEKEGAKAIDKNPSYAINALSKLSQENIPEHARLSIAKLMTKTAIEKPTSNTGKMAVKSLHKMIKSEGENSVSREAFSGLTKAAKVGNGSAVESLESIANDNTVSYNKAYKAVSALSNLAQESPGSNVASSAIKSLNKVAKKQGENCILRGAFQGLKDSAMNGNKEALNSLGNIAVDNRLSQNKNFKALDALNDISKSGKDSAGDATKMLTVIALKKSADPEVRKRAVKYLIGTAATNGPASKIATKGLMEIVNSNDSVGDYAIEKISKASGNKNLNNKKALTSIKDENQFKQLLAG